MVELTTFLSTTISSFCGKAALFYKCIGSRECQLIHFCNCFDFQMCLKVLWQSTVHYQLSICSIGLSFACLWLNTRRRCAKHVREKLWARRPRAKWSPMSEREGPRPRKHGRVRIRPSNFLLINLDSNVLGWKSIVHLLRKGILTEYNRE